MYELHNCFAYLLLSFSLKKKQISDFPSATTGESEVCSHSVTTRGKTAANPTARSGPDWGMCDCELSHWVLIPVGGGGGGSGKKYHTKCIPLSQPRIATGLLSLQCSSDLGRNFLDRWWRVWSFVFGFIWEQRLLTFLYFQQSEHNREEMLKT